MDDKARIRCPACKTVFREKCTRLREGVQLNCSNCSKLVTLNRETDDAMMRRALKTAREFRAAQEAKIVEAAYGKEYVGAPIHGLAGHVDVLCPGALRPKALQKPMDAGSDHANGRR